MAIRNDERGILGAAVLASILLHLSFIAALPGWHEIRRPADQAPIIARLAPQARPEPQAADAPERSRVSSPVATRTRPSSAPRSSEALREEPSPAVMPSDFAHQEVTALGASRPGSQTPERVTREARAPSQEDPTLAPFAIPASAIATLSQYRLAVMARARGLNRYPQAAIENVWQGRSDLRLRIAADGGVESVEVSQGSGYAVLDREAVAMIGEAARRVPIPDSLRGREFAIEIPVIFSLQTAAR